MNKKTDTQTHEQMSEQKPVEYYYEYSDNGNRPLIGCIVTVAGIIIYSVIKGFLG